MNGGHEMPTEASTNNGEDRLGSSRGEEALLANDSAEFESSIQSSVNALSMDELYEARLEREDRDWIMNVLPASPISSVADIARIISSPALEFLKTKGIVTDEIIAQAIQLKQRKRNELARRNGLLRDERSS